MMRGHCYKHGNYTGVCTACREEYDKAPSPFVALRKEDDCTGLRSLLDAAERRQEEMEAQISILTRARDDFQEKYARISGENDALLTDLAGLRTKLDVGFEVGKALVQRVWGEGEDHDRQLRDFCDWLGIEVP